MLAKIIDGALDNRWLVLSLLVFFMAAGVYIAMRLPVDAFPDLTNNQVVVTTECPAMPPTEVERRVTFPIEAALMGIPRTLEVRSTSKLGLSMVTVIFEDSVDTYFSRQLVNERIQEVRSRLPAGLQPAMGPVATAFGEVYQYTVEGPQTLMDRKTIHDWMIRYQVRGVAGINEVNSWGGESKQYTIEVDPGALHRYDLTLRDLFQRVQNNNENFGGGFIDHSGEQYTVYGLGRAQSPEDLGKVVLKASAGTPVLLSDVARITISGIPRQGAVLRDGRGETVSGMAIALKGANGLEVIQRVKARLAGLRLPDGMTIVPFYDQSEVINGTIGTVTRNLIEAGFLVMAVLFLFLGNLRPALIVAAVIPMSMLFGFMGMAVFGISANLMSLGAIDFGMIVDGAVVMMENSVRKLREEAGSSILAIIRSATHEVARPIAFAVAIIVAVYLPVLTLEGLEGRMFRPMAITVCSALAGSLVLTIAVVPVLAAFGLRPSDKEKHLRWLDGLQRRYGHALDFVLAHRAGTLAAGAVLVLLALGSVRFIGTEFMPKLDEGSILVQTRKLPGISLDESIALSTRMEQAIRELPEVRGVVSKLGRPDLATEAMGVYEGDVYVLLKPEDQWPKRLTKDELVDKLSKRLSTISGVVSNFTQPMAMRLDETVSGIKADVAIKIFGDDPKTLEVLADKALRTISAIPGAADPQAEVLLGVPTLQVEVDRGSLAQYGLDVTDVRDLLDSTTGGRTISEMVEGDRIFPISVRLPAEYRDDLTSLGNLQLQSAAGERVRLNQVARITVQPGPELVSRENARRRIVVQANVRGRDLGSFVKEAQDRVALAAPAPPGYSIEWGGQFENQQHAMRRLSIVLPASIAIVFGLLVATFRSPSQAVLIFLAVPFAMVGGIGALWFRGLNLNLSAIVGFIALFGVAVLNGIVMVSCINQLRAMSVPLLPAIRQGAILRLRPVLMTALVASLGFLPMAISTSIGAEVQRPLATVVIGGLITSTILTLLVLPAAYPWFSPQMPAARPRTDARE